MGKNVVNKRSKGKVDFKRKEDQVRSPVGDEDDKTEVCDDKNNEHEIEVIMKKCKVISNFVKILEILGNISFYSLKDI